MSEYTDISSLEKAMDFIMNLPPVRAIIAFFVSGGLLLTFFIPSLFDRILSMQIFILIFYAVMFLIFVCSGVCLLRHSVRYISMRCEKRRRNNEQKSIEREARVRDEELKGVLLSLSPSMASLLWFIYMNRPMRGACAAYIPCDNLDAKELHSRGLITSKLTPIKRGRGYDYACECYDYRLSENVISFLDRRGKELGEMWGYKGGIPALGKYQRADKAIILESGMR